VVIYSIVWFSIDIVLSVTHAMVSIVNLRREGMCPIFSKDKNKEKKDGWLLDEESKVHLGKVFKE